MIQANEIRVGNLIHYTTLDINTGMQIQKEHTVSSNTIKEIEMRHNAPYFGIPLTEEWLVKLGFRLNNTTVSTSVWTPDEPSTTKTYSESPLQPSLNYRVEAGIFTCTGRIITNVHQLQNLYFALTGTDLIYQSN